MNKINLKSSIIIPAYNEAKNLSILIDEITKSLIKCVNFEIIIVNDFSTDSTSSVCDMILENNNQINIKIIENKLNEGQSKSIFNGINSSTYHTIITIDADLQNDPKDILKLHKHYVDNECKLVGGIRLGRKDNLNKIIASKIANYLRSLILNDNCKDTGCGLKVFDKYNYMKLPFFNGQHRFFPALFKALKVNISFVPVSHRKRKFGVSKYGVVKRGLKGLIDIIRVFYFIKFKY